MRSIVEMEALLLEKEWGEGEAISSSAREKKRKDKGKVASVFHIMKRSPNRSTKKCTLGEKVNIPFSRKRKERKEFGDI